MWALVFFVAGIAVGIYGIGLVRDARRCGTWPTVDGRIVTAEPQVVSREKSQRTYAPNVVYTYVVDGKSYESSRVTLVPRNYSQLSAVEAVLARYPAGGAVKVFHDPNDPANCVLVTTSTGSEWAYPIAAVLFLGVGVMLLKQA